MAKKILLMFILLSFVALIQPVMAQEPTAANAGGGTDLHGWMVIASGFALAIAAAACGIGQSNAFRSAAEGMSRNPGSTDAIRGALILVVAFIESLAIYVFVIALILLFVKW